jgi:uncharacterized coiled-coil protein SlyX
LQQEADELEKAVAQQQTIVAEFRQQFTELEGTLQTAEANPDKSDIAGLKNQIAGLRSHNRFCFDSVWTNKSNACWRNNCS